MGCTQSTPIKQSTTAVLPKAVPTVAPTTDAMSADIIEAVTIRGETPAEAAETPAVAADAVVEAVAPAEPVATSAAAPAASVVAQQQEHGAPRFGSISAKKTKKAKAEKKIAGTAASTPVVVSEESIAPAPADKENVAAASIMAAKQPAPARSALASRKPAVTQQQQPLSLAKPVEIAAPVVDAKKVVSFEAKAVAKKNLAAGSRKKGKKVANVDSNLVLQMTLAFERMLTNAATLEVQLGRN